MQVRESDARKLFNALGLESSNWKTPKLLRRLNNLKDVLSDPDTKDLEDMNDQSLCDEILDAIDSGEEILLSEEEDDIDLEDLEDLAAAEEDDLSSLTEMSLKEYQALELDSEPEEVPGHVELNPAEAVNLETTDSILDTLEVEEKPAELIKAEEEFFQMNGIIPVDDPNVVDELENVEKPILYVDADDAEDAVIPEATEEVKPVKKPKKPRKPAERDEFHCSKGTMGAKINAAVTRTPKDAKVIAAETGLTVGRVYGHLRWMQKKGYAEKTDAGYIRKAGY